MFIGNYYYLFILFFFFCIIDFVACDVTYITKYYPKKLGFCCSSILIIKSTLVLVRKYLLCTVFIISCLCIHDEFDVLKVLKGNIAVYYYFSSEKATDNKRITKASSKES